MTIVDCDNGDAFAWLALRIVCSCGQRERSFPERGSRTTLLGFDDLLGRVGVGDEVEVVAGGVETLDNELARRRAVLGGGAMLRVFLMVSDHHHCEAVEGATRT